MSLSRRSFLAGLALSATPASSQQSATLARWTPGTLDIHHISTGRGNCTLCILPDATTFMIDAGALMPTGDDVQYQITPFPDSSRRPGEWLGRYAKRHLAPANRNEIDHFLLTHFHSDHMGQFVPGLPQSKQGTHHLTGFADVAELMPIGRIVDRGFPNYNYPTPINDPSTNNYRECGKALARTGTKLEAFRVGTTSQFTLLRKPADFPNFEVRNIVANGELWTGIGDNTRKCFPELATLKPNQYPTENMCSTGIRIRYGAFDYFSAGDLPDGSSYGVPAWRDIETAATQIAGPVDVALASHHGYIDSTGPAVVRALRPRAFIIHAWDSAHPTMPALHNMLSQDLYPGPRDIFATAMKPEAKITIRRLSQIKSDNGHVLVRVAPGGASYQIHITTNRDESDRLTASFGPYTST